MPNEQENTPSTTNDNTFRSFDDGASSPAPERPFTPVSPISNPVAAPSEIEPSTATVVGGQGEPSTSFPQEQTVSATPVIEDKPNAFATAATPAVFPANDGLDVAPKKSKKKLIIAGVIAGVLALCVGGGAAAYNLWYQNPDKVIGDALGNALVSKTAKTDTKMTFKGGEGSSAGTVDLTFNTLNNQKDARIDVTVASDIESAKFDVSGSLVVKNNEKLFVKVDKLKEMLEKSGMQAYLGGSESVTALVNKLDSNWVVITKEEIEENTGSKDEASECVETAVEKLRTDKKYSDELADLYKKYPLVGVKEKLGSKDGSLGYEIEFKRGNAIKFANGVNSTKFFADLKKCDDKIENLDGEEMFKEESDNNDGDAKVVVWIDRWSHQFTKFEVTGKSKDSSGKLTTNMKFDVPVSIEEPKNPITIDELKSDIEAIQQEMMQASEATTVGDSSPMMRTGSEI